MKRTGWVLVLSILIIYGISMPALAQTEMHNASNEFDLENLPEDEQKQIAAQVKEEKTSEAACCTEKIIQQAAELQFKHREIQEKNAFQEVLILAVLAFTSLVTVLYFMTRKSRKCESRDVVSISGLILIIYSTLILVIIADADQQITAAIGILGAVAGYLFGSNSTFRSSENADDSLAKTKPTLDEREPD